MLFRSSGSYDGGTAGLAVDAGGLGPTGDAPTLGLSNGVAACDTGPRSGAVELKGTTSVARDVGAARSNGVAAAARCDIAPAGTGSGMVWLVGTWSSGGTPVGAGRTARREGGIAS